MKDAVAKNVPVARCASQASASGAARYPAEAGKLAADGRVAVGALGDEAGEGAADLEVGVVDGEGVPVGFGQGEQAAGAQHPVHFRQHRRGDVSVMVSSEAEGCEDVVDEMCGPCAG